MKSRLFFRQSGYVIRTHSRWEERLFVVAAVLAVVLVLGRATAHDEADRLAYEATMRADLHSPVAADVNCAAVAQRDQAVQP